MSRICRSIFSLCQRLYTTNLYPTKKKLYIDLSLYLVANLPTFKKSEHQFFANIIKAIEGATCVQLRDHESDFRDTVKRAAHLKKILKGTPLFINTRDSCKVMEAVGAEGVFLEEPNSVSEVRKQLGKNAIIGIRVNNEKDVLDAEGKVDYLSVKIGPSRTCQKNDNLWDMDRLKQIRAITSLPIIVVGGLKAEGVESIYRELRPNDGIAMAGGLMDEEDPGLTARKIQEIRQKVRKFSGGE